VNAAERERQRREAWEWRYVQGGQCVHALTRAGSSTVGIARARCGVSPTLWTMIKGAPSLSWYGTGSQAEYDRAASLPLCRRCVARIA
jgi:hypothetical protein